MNAAILQRVIWKEYRFLRSFGLATLLLAACAAVAWRGLAAWYERPVQGEDFFILVAIVTSLFALGVGGTSFATEHEVGTAEFLRRLPLDGKNLLCGKLLLSAVSIVGLKVVLWAGAAIISTWLPVSGERLRTIWWCGIVSELELFAWGMLFSLLTRQPLMAITWGITVATVVVHLMPAIFRGDDHRPDNYLLHDYGFALPGRTAFALAMLASVAWLTTKWIRSPQPLSVIPDWLSRLTLVRRRTVPQIWPATTAASQSSLLTENGQIKRLIWLQWRQSRLLWASLAVPFVASGLWKLTTNYQADITSFLFAASTGILWLGLGISVFHGQQAHFRFRYFAERGISPARVWWGHQLALLPPLVVSFGLTVIVVAATDNVLPTITPLQRVHLLVEQLGMLALVASIVFAIGQLAGMLFRQAIIAGAMGIVALVVHGCWGALLGISVLAGPASNVRTALIMLIGFGSFPITWLWLSRRHISNWILERRTWATRLRLAVCLVVPWMLMATGLMTYRVLEIPNFGAEPPIREQLLTLNDEERKTAEMYQAVINALGIDINRLPSHDKLMQEVDQRLQHSPELLTRILVATSRPNGAFAGEPQQQNTAAFLILRILVRIERQASEQQDVSKSIELFEAQRRLLLHWRRNTDFEGLKHCEGVEGSFVRNLMRHLRASSWQPEQYRELARRMSEVNAIYKNRSRRAWEREYRNALDCLSGRDLPLDVSADRQDLLFQETSFLSQQRWLLWLPGEHARAKRLLNAKFASHVGVEKANAPGFYEFLAQAEWSTPWARILERHIQRQGQKGRSDYSLHGRWQTLQAWLELHVAKAELGDWPASAEDIPAVGDVKLPGGGGGTVVYFPKGLYGGRAPEPLKVLGTDRRRFRLNGNEPCLGFYHSGSPIHPIVPNVIKRLVNAKDSEDRQRSLGNVLVEPLDPVPSEPEQSPPTR